MTHAEIRTQFLAALADSSGSLVENLRVATAILRGDTDELTCSEKNRDHIAHVVANALEAAAQRLCEHVRHNSDGTCRYCNLLMGVDE